MLTNDVVRFERLDPALLCSKLTQDAAVTKVFMQTQELLPYRSFSQFLAKKY